MSTLPLAVALSLVVSAVAQDLIGVNFAGQAFAIDSRVGRGALLGPTGRTGHNAMARVGSTLYVSEQAAGPTFFLDTLNEITGTATRSVAIARDLRGMAQSRNGGLAAIANGSAGDEFVSVSTSTGAVTVIGNTGFTGIQALAINSTFLGDVIFAWDSTAGLIRIDRLTGVGTDVNANFGTGGVDIQFLAFAGGRLLGGRNELYEIDAGSGLPALIGAGGYSDLRGLEERFGVAVPFGQGCGGVTLAVTGSFSINGTFTSTSSGHIALAPGALMLGSSATAFQGIPLPLDLDPFLHTSGCRLLTSADFMLNSATTVQGVMSLSLVIPLFTQGSVFHLQHFSLDDGPGGLAFSNGVTVRVRL